MFSHIQRNFQDLNLEEIVAIVYFGATPNVDADWHKVSLGMVRTSPKSY